MAKKLSEIEKKKKEEDKFIKSLDGKTNEE